MPTGHPGIILYQKICPVCKKEFSVPAQKRRQVCCSKECGLKRMVETNKARQTIHQITKDQLVSAIEQAKDEDPVYGPKVYRVAEILGVSNYMVHRLERKHSVYVSDYKTPVVRNDGYYGYTSSANHRRVMEKHIGRLLEKNEVVHHIDGDRLNNDVDNLCLMTMSEHTALHKAEFELVYELLKNGIVGFDRESKRYYLKDRGEWT